MLEVSDLSLSLSDYSRKPPFGPAPLIDILQGIGFTLDAGEALGIVGESGSGKTTLGRTVVRLYEPTAGKILFEGEDITHLPETELRRRRDRFQMIFQDPQSSLNPRQKVGAIVARPLWTYGRVGSQSEAEVKVRDLLDRVALRPDLADRFPHELSGGQRQRVGIARAIALSPGLVVADEIVSGLDVSSQAQILQLLRDLRAEMKLALIFISHDLSVVRAVCDRVLVMLEGRVVEAGPCADLFAQPRHAYTRKLLNAIPLPDVDPDWVRRAADTDTGEILKMDIEGSVALVTGANRGVGEAFVTALIERGAAKVYAAVRDPAGYQAPEGAEVVALDITKPDQINTAADQCRDVTLLVNNAGVNHNQPLSAEAAISNAREELEVNYLGTLAMSRAFAPVLGTNGGGAMVNMLSILSRVNLPVIGSYCASKAAALSMTQGVRAELAAQNTLVVAVMPGSIDTRMTPDGEEKPTTIAHAALDAVEAGTEDIYPGDMAQGVSQGLAADPKAVEKQFATMLPQ